MREFEEGRTKVRIVLEFGHVLLDSVVGMRPSLAKASRWRNVSASTPGDGTTAYMTAR